LFKNITFDSNQIGFFCFGGFRKHKYNGLQLDGIVFKDSLFNENLALIDILKFEEDFDNLLELKNLDFHGLRF
jgi:hypothetical protein